MIVTPLEQAAIMQWAITAKTWTGIEVDSRSHEAVQATNLAVETWLRELPSKINPPEAIRFAIARRFAAEPDNIQYVLNTLQFNGDYWYFTLHGMFWGIEPDGYIHT